MNGYVVLARTPEELACEVGTIGGALDAHAAVFFALELCDEFPDADITIRKAAVHAPVLA